MDEPVLATQLAKTGNLPDLLSADHWGQADDCTARRCLNPKIAPPTGHSKP